MAKEQERYRGSVPAPSKSEQTARELAERDADAQAAAAATKAEDAEATLSEIDELLDEIDSVLEENAEEFVKAYIQKGGQ
jgi:ubiquitin-like protein Pup